MYMGDKHAAYSLEMIALHHQMQKLGSELVSSESSEIHLSLPSMARVPDAHIHAYLSVNAWDSHTGSCTHMAVTLTHRLPIKLLK